MLATKPQVCAAIKSTKPSGCSSQPTIAGLSDGGAAPGNGCGDGWSTRAKAWAGLQVNFGSEFTGNVDAPSAGASFLSACNAHDICYAGQGAQDVCDKAFGEALTVACRTAVVPSRCDVIGAYYLTLVRDKGGDAYAKSGEELRCYNYHQ